MHVNNFVETLLVFKTEARIFMIYRRYVTI